MQGAIGSAGWRWIAGVNLLNFDIGSVDVARMNEGQDEADLLPSVEEQPGLYEKYIEWGLISPEEADGGFIPELKGGFVYDTRDNRPNPMEGVWTEAVLVAAPEFLGSESGFGKMAITHRQYFTLIPEDLSLAYRLGWQHTLWGDVPFYYQSQVITSVMTGASSTGLGGVRSLRGIKRNRVVGDGMVFGNFELRWKALYFNFINQPFIWASILFWMPVAPLLLLKWKADCRPWTKTGTIISILGRKRCTSVTAWACALP